MSVALLGGVARLYHDTRTDEAPISRRDWVSYLTTALLAGIIFGGFLHHYQGWSPLLVPIAGLSGFGATQMLGLAVKLWVLVVETKVDRLFGLETKKKKEDNGEDSQS